MSRVESYPWHADAWQTLAASRTAGRMPHALLLSGPPGLGKAAFARRLGDALVCASPSAAGDACGSCSACRMSAAGTHPDQAFIEPEEAGKAIKIDAVRQLTARSVLAAQESAYRVFVIMPAEAMNRAAANALLKTLEEPAPRSLLLLVSSHPSRLPATIRSRCQVLDFRTPPVGDAAAWLREQGQGGDIDALLAIGAGAPLRAMQAAADDWLGEATRLLTELTALKQRKSNPLQIVEEWEKRPLTFMLDGFKRFTADLIRINSGAGDARLYHPGMGGDLQTLGQGIDLQELYFFNDGLLESERAAANNLNVPMMLEHIANHWLKITRPGGR